MLNDRLPIPTHLQAILMPVGEDDGEYQVTGALRCSCGCEEFRVEWSNGRRLVRALCAACGREYLVFDEGRHGWDGFVCGSDGLDRTQPWQRERCACGEDAFRVQVAIHSQGQDDFVAESGLLQGPDDRFSPEDWVDAFEWITISLACPLCGAVQEGWVDAETM